MEQAATDNNVSASIRVCIIDPFNTAHLLNMATALVIAPVSVGTATCNRFERLMEIVLR